MRSVRVVVAEDCTAVREALVRELEHRSGILVVGAAQNGVEALHLVREHRPQVLVCDMVMPQLDGFGVLEGLAQLESTHRPRVIALTALSRDDFISRAMELGAAYYMVKPANMDCLTHKILALAGSGAAALPDAPPQEEESAEQGVANLLLEMGVPAHLNGYRFLLHSALMALAHPDYLDCITLRLYPAVASLFSTTAGCVERSIRHAIGATWARGGAAAFEAVLNRRCFSESDKPTNCELIALLSEQARLRGWGRLLPPEMQRH